MRHLLFLLAILVIGAVMLVPAISVMGLEPLPGDFTIHTNDFRMAVPVTYSLCASMGLGLLYYLLRR
jgi:hypothetical protein